MGGTDVAGVAVRVVHHEKRLLVGECGVVLLLVLVLAYLGLGVTSASVRVAFLYLIRKTKPRVAVVFFRKL